MIDENKEGVNGPAFSRSTSEDQFIRVLAKYYEHIDPRLHMYFYELHFKYENQLVQYYWMLREQNPNMDNE